MTALTTVLRSIGALAALALCAFALPAGAQEEGLKNAPHVDLTMMGRAAVTRSLPLLQDSAAAFREQTGGTCFSCHHQSLPSMVTALARQRSFIVDMKRSQEELDLVHNFFGRIRPILEKAQTNAATDRELDLVTVDPALTMGYALAGLAAGNCKSDATTIAMTRYLMRKQITDGRWPVLTARPPMESSEFATTALAVRAMQVYTPASDAQEVARRTASARTWLLTARPKTTEDRAFQLLGLRWVHADSKRIATAVEELCALQGDLGGWAQLTNAPADAYATGLALYALNQGGELPTESGAYRRGMFFLITTQEKDGSWLVVKRAPPVQTFFDTRFPHEKSQFSSYAGTCWATMALALAVPTSQATAKVTATTH